MHFPQIDWQILSFPEPSKLDQATQQIHHAAQFVALIGDSLLPKRSDDSQSNMGWNAEFGGLVGHPIELDQTVFMGLSYDPFQLHILNQDLRSILSTEVAGKNKSDLLAWAKTTIQQLGGDAHAVQPISHFDLPDHPVDHGAAFEVVDPIFHQELKRYRLNSDRILNHFASQFEHASTVRTWPHHFDIGSYIPLTHDSDGQATKSIGIGLAIADSDIDELYFYINYWAKDEHEISADLPSLQLGDWVTEGWQGMYLKVSELLKSYTASEQLALTNQFFLKGVNVALGVINAEEFKLSIDKS